MRRAGLPGRNPIGIELLLEAAFDTGSGAYAAHLETAYQAGREIGVAVTA